jgi:hypothetical protein
MAKLYGKGTITEIVKGKKYRLALSAGKDPITGKYRRHQETFLGTKRQAELRIEQIRRELENGKAVKIPLSAYETKGPRKKLTGAYSTVSPIVAVFKEEKPFDLTLFSSDKKAIQISSSLIPQKSTKSAAGSIMMTLKKGARVWEERPPVQRYSFGLAPVNK